VDSTLRRDAVRLADHVASLDDFIWRHRRTAAYNHVGATLSDAALQAGVSYRSIVLPRVERILRRWPLQACTTTGLLAVIEDEGVEVVLKWRHPEKPRRLIALAELLHRAGVEDEPAMAAWLRGSSNRSRLLEIKGIGPKTVDYLGVLVGNSTIAVDRHVRAFVLEAGIVRESYDEVKAVVELAAEALSVDRATLDASIWDYASRRVA
jgi:hypothetical protein